MISAKLENVLHLFNDGKNRKDVDLVLSTGGARGLAHIGAILQLEEMGYHIRSIAGTSMGALVGGLYAAGGLGDFREWMKTIDKKKIHQLYDFSFSLNHIVKGDRIMKALKQIVPDKNIENLSIPYCAIATDAVSGKEVIFRKGSMYQAIRASISIPVFFNPVRQGERMYLDGGLVNPLPLNRLKRDKKALLVAIDVSGHDYEGEVMMNRLIRQRNLDHSFALSILNKMLPHDLDLDLNYITLLNRTTSIMIHQNTKLALKVTPPDIYVEIPMSRYSTFDFDKSERLIAIGRTKTRKMVERFLNSGRED
ncbi:MAG: patatin-like phospholipase family protein [Prevotella sp.]|jgi:NTE family protein|nr:patatin-like phospholipase family protein [Prevotella sp.]MCH4211383.1 patatin-like phospholipase family protein [Prevotella sp.]MCH4240456.1 patatin-like phospholipase family protein [Prevotella sp.]